jgi:hypothetical protein
MPPVIRPADLQLGLQLMALAGAPIRQSLFVSLFEAVSSHLQGDKQDAAQTDIQSSEVPYQNLANGLWQNYKLLQTLRDKKKGYFDLDEPYRKRLLEGVATLKILKGETKMSRSFRSSRKWKS